jgi:GT2 family glycosyltransferase
VVWWRGRPCGALILGLRAGSIGGGHLRDAIGHTLGRALLRCWLRDRVGWNHPAPQPATVAVCTRDRPDDLARCLAALARLPAAGQEILVVDSASRSDATRREAARWPGVRYVREDRPGLNRARNRALAEARHAIVAFVDDDAEPHPGWLRALTSPFHDRRVMGTTGLTLPLELETPAQEAFERTNGFGRGFARRTYHGTRDHPFLVARIGAGANMALRRDVAERVAGFDPRLDAGTPTRSGGDHDMFSRILASGHSIEYVPEAVCRHRHRREWRELRDTVYGYGVGVYATLSAHVLRGELKALPVGAVWFASQLRDLIRGLLRRPGHPPVDLVAAQLGGSIAGPFALLRSHVANRQGSESR